MLGRRRFLGFTVGAAAGAAVGGAAGAGMRALFASAESPIVPPRGPERVVRASRDALVRATLRAGGDVIVLTPEKLRREVRNRARDIARAHKS